MPPNKKNENKTIYPSSKCITGKPELFGKVKVPREHIQTDPTTMAAIDPATKIA